MPARCSTWLLLIALCAACAGGTPPPPPTRPAATSEAGPTHAAASPTPLPDLAPATAPPTTATAAPTLSAASSVTPAVGLITPATAASLTQTALIATGKLDQVAWAPGGALLAAAGASGVTLYEAATLTATAALPIGQWATSLAFDPSGRDLAVGTVGAVVQVWNLERLEPTTLLLGPGVRVQRVIYNPAGGGVLASLGVDNLAHLWYVDGQQYLRALGASVRPAHALAFSPTGDWLATAESGRVLLWDVDLALAFADPTPRTLLPPPGRRGAVTALAFSPAGDLAVANTTGSIELWDPAALQPAQSLARLNTPALYLAYSPDGQLLASAHQDRALRLWDTATGQLLIALPGHTDLVTSLAFSPDGTRLASSSWDGSLRLWSLP